MQAYFVAYTEVQSSKISPAMKSLYFSNDSFLGFLFICINSYISLEIQPFSTNLPVVCPVNSSATVQQLKSMITSLQHNRL